MAQSAPPGATVYRLSLAKLLTIHIALCFVMVGFVTLPVALLRRSKTRLVVTDRNLSFTTGVTSVTTNAIPLTRVDNVHTERSVWDRMFGCGTLVVSAGGGTPTRITNLANVDKARADIEARTDAAHAHG